METPERSADATPAHRLSRRGCVLRFCTGALAGASATLWAEAAGAASASLSLAASPPGPSRVLPPPPLGATTVSPAPLTLRSAAQSGSLLKYAPGDRDHPGLCTEIAVALQRLDPHLHLEGLDRTVPLRRLELMLASDELDVFLCLLPSERRREMMRFLPIPLYRVRHVLMVRAGTPTPQSWTALRAFARRRPLLLVQGSQLAVTLKQADVAHVEAARSEVDAVQMLLRGRADAVYGQDVALRHAVRLSGVQGALIEFGPHAFDEQPQLAAVSRRLPEPAVERLTERLRQLQASGELGRIVDRYR
ncbi:transporter substrate-binding domain-containing protein [Roseateles sp. SL47]|uniref:substrate-binding periplasmic protein n=1 Tax=Roseateles sp. SL47 TaxID=2995138 RepID=UPI00226FFC18|nr:transporter substrate-binding domain-containing protein [Roseateles sp. SL47]WAC73694.1 transporter substrate-binding domain-containing protein [Roseateles sp. SL47]